MRKIILNHPVLSIIICTLILFSLVIGISCGFIFYPLITLIILGILIGLSVCSLIACFILKAIVEHYNK